MGNTDLRHFTDENFDAEVLRSDAPALVDFTASWCAPCRAIAPIVDALAAGYRGVVKVGTLDTEAHQQVAARYGVRSLPTLLLFQNGEVVAQLVGAGPKLRGQLEEILQKALQRAPSRKVS